MYQRTLSVSTPVRSKAVGRPIAARFSGIGFVVWSVLAALPWLLPTHSAPWTTVYQELLMAAAVTGVAAWTLILRRPWKVDFLAIGFLAASSIPPLQSAAGMFAIPREAPLVSLYLVGFALTLLVARKAEEAAPGRLVESLLAAILIAALVSTGLALYQWLGGDGMGLLVAPMPFRDRPVANVGQPNNLATLLGWGLVAVWWAHLHRHVGGKVAVLSAAFVMIGITLTQSRAGVLEVVLLGAVALVGRRRLGTNRQAPAFIGLAIWFIACALALEPLTHLWTEQLTRPLLDAGSPRERTMLLKMVLTAIGRHPWFGYGWNQNVTAHVALASEFPMHGTVGNAHNLVLDLIVWNGLPLGILLTVGLIAWVWHAIRRTGSPQHLLVLAALGVLWVHTMLELPHVLAYFLVPAAIMMGTLNAWAPLPTLLQVPRPVMAAAVIAVGMIVTIMFGEYVRIERNGIDAAMRAAHFAHAPMEQDPHAVLLRSLQDGLRLLRTEPERDMPLALLTDFRKAVTRYPTSLGLLRYAQASAMNGRPDDARWALGVLCSLHPVSECEAAASDWAALTAEGRPELASVKVPVAIPTPPH